MEILGVALVKNQKDKYVVVFNEKIKYDYTLLDELSIKINSPLDNFEFIVNSELK